MELNQTNLLSFQRRKQGQYPRAIPLVQPQIEALKVRLQAELPPAISVALTLVASTFLPYLRRARQALPSQELQGYLDTLALFIAAWINQATFEDEENPQAFDLAQISELAQYPAEFLDRARTLLQHRLEWAKKAFVAEDADYGRELMGKIGRRLAAENKDPVYRSGVQTAQQTFLLYSDYASTFDLSQPPPAQAEEQQ